MSTKYQTLLDLLARSNGVEAGEAAKTISVSRATVRGMIRDLASFVSVSRIRLTDRRRVLYRLSGTPQP